MRTKYYEFGDLRLTHHEMKLISLLIQFSDRWKIAEKLKITEGTLGQEVKYLYAKLRIHCLQEVLLWAWKNGFASNGKFLNKKLA